MFAAGKTAAVSGAAPDDKFNYVTMLLHGDGTNGAQNNTFVDSSTNNFTITRNGNTTQGSFSPYGSNWSGYFDSGANISSSTWNSAGVFGTSDFTVECWVYAVAAQNSNQVIFTNSAYPSTNGFYFRYTGSGSTDFTVNTGTSTLITASGGWSLNAWHHVAVTRASGTMTLWIDGVSRGTSSFTNNCSDGMQFIGRTYDTGANYFMQGYLSNFRITKLAALYTSTFTPSTTPLTTTVSSGTVSLLCLQSNRFIDNSTNAYALTANNSPSVQRFNPFGTATAYSTSVIGGSGYFDGSGDYLQVANDSAFDFSGDFTVECWLYLANTNNQTFISKGGHNALGPDAAGWALFIYTGQGLRFMTRNSGGTNVPVTVASTPQINTWMHVAISRSGSSMKAFLNGTLVSTVTSSVNTANSSPFNIGANLNNLSPSTGYICDVRIIKGTAQYTATFTPPTAPLTAITDTQFLENFTNGAIFDNAMMTTLETVGNAQISTSVKKYGTGSIYLDGTGDWITSKPSVNTAFGTGDFTVEFWINSTQTTRTDPIGINDDYNTTGWWGMVANIGSSGQLSWYENTNQRINATSTNWNNGSWNHIAVTRSGNSVRMFVNGTQVGSTYTTSFSYGINGTNIYGVNIGYLFTTEGNALNGYIDDFRITKGFARYTTTFTPPTSALSDTGPY